MRHGRSEQVEECFAGEDGRLAEGAGGARGVRRSSAAPWAERPPRGSEGRCGLERRRPRQVVGERMPQQGKTPGKYSRTGKEVQERIRKEGTLKDGPDGMEFKSSDGEWYPIRYADMSHKTDAVSKKGHDCRRWRWSAADIEPDSAGIIVLRWGLLKTAGHSRCPGNDVKCVAA